MLAGLRNAAKSKIAIPIIVILAASFAVWGVNDIFTMRAGDAVGRVGPETVTVSDYQRAFSTAVQRQATQSGRAFTTQDARAAGLDQQILQQMMQGAAIDAKASDMNLGASDAAVSQDIRATEAFQDTVRGEFSRDVYESALGGVGMTPRNYEDSIRTDIARGQILNSALVRMRPPEVFVDAREAYRNETRTAEVLILPAALVDLDEEPSDADLQALIDENGQAFTFPELRALTVVWLNMETMEAIVEVSDDDVEALFEFRRESMSSPATRSFVQIAAQDEETANAAAERLRAGEAPGDIAASLNLASPIIQDEAARADIVDAQIAEAIFESTEPRVVVAEGVLGWAAIQVTGATEAQEANLDASTEALRAELARDGATDTLYEAISELEDARGAGMTLEEAAREAGVAAQSYAPVSAQGRDMHGDFYIDLAAAPELLSRAFSMAAGQTSDLVELPDGNGYAVVRVDDIQAQRVATLSEAREDARAFWRSRQVGEALQEVEARAREIIEGGGSFGEAAEAIGQPARIELAVFKRGQSAGPVDARLSAELFEAAQGELISGRTAGDSRALARVTKIEQQAEDAPNVSAELGDELASDLFVQFQNALFDEYRVETYPDQIDLALGDTTQ